MALSCKLMKQVKELIKEL